MNPKIKQVKDKEGVVFIIVLDPKVRKKTRKRDSNVFVKSLIEEKLKSNNVFPINNRVGFTGDIESVSFYISSLIELYLEKYSIDNQLDIIYGSLGSIIVTLIFFYIVNMIFILGAEFNYLMKHNIDF